MFGQRKSISLLTLAAVACLPFCIGCAGSARVELAAAQSVEAVADEMQKTLGEYHQEV